MNIQVVAVAAASALALSGGAFAQASAAKAKEMEAVVLVTKVDSSTGIVHAQTRKGQTFAVRPPSDVNLSEIQEGSRYKVRYSEPVALAIEPGAQAAAAGATREAERGAKPGESTITAKLAGVIESSDPAKKQITVRTTDGTSQTLSLGEGVSTASLKTGDAVTVTYQRALATRMASTPQPITDPAPPP
jgi:hypothetical protein